MATKKKALQAAAGNAGGDLLAIEDVFSTYLYSYESNPQTINNGIDLAGEGGLIVTKNRVNATDWKWVDTERSGLNKALTSSDSNSEDTDTGGVLSVTSSGYTLGTNSNYNSTNTANKYASWTFRKAPRFFDVVTASIPDPEPSTFTVNHNLGTTVGMVIVKSTTHTYDWTVFHRSLPSNYNLFLNQTAGQSFFGGTNWSSTDTTVTLPGWAGQSGGDVVIYLFAHDPLGPSGDGSDGLISCGSFGHNFSGAEVNLGWEPQWILVKAADQANNWYVFDAMRGIVTGGNDAALFPNTSDAENVNSWGIEVTSTGFVVSGNNILSSGNAIYIAIRRGPMRVPESGTEVFDVNFASATATNPAVSSTISVIDMAILSSRTGTDKHYLASRLTGGYLKTDSGAATASPTADAWTFDNHNGFYQTGGTLGTNYLAWMFRRAPGFFDVVAYTGDGVAGRTVPHNLGVAPEMMWVKDRDNVRNWVVYHSGIGETGAILLNNTNGSFTDSTQWNDTAPSVSSFTLGASAGVNGSSNDYIAYLFASLNGVSKVGSYTGNGSSQTIDCGFSSGARFILIKRTDSTGDWYVWDTARGIVAANDPHLSLNTTAAEVTTDDSIDPDSSGFIVNQVAATNVNVSSASYIFLAIA